MNNYKYYVIIWYSACILCFIRICYAVTYTDQWAVHIEGGEEFAKQLAEKHGFTYLEQIMPDYYHLHHRSVSKRSIYPSDHVHEHLSQEPEVRWLEQQVAKKRVKRDVSFSDPKWPRMWYMNRGRGLDMNVMDAWAQKITGKGVVVSILDDGIERDHPDLKKNYDAGASYDVNGHDPDPTPRYDYTNENRHGTRCAGEVAAEADNGVCSVGVAYDASIGGVRMLDGDVTDAVEARSLSLNPQHIDIYSASWGPDDDGQTVDGPASMAKKAFEDGIEKGRQGKGSIFVWASGNGGRDGDSCNCDGYTNSIYTLSISSATENGHIPWYSEACSSTLATTYSSGSGGERQIVTTDLRKDCTEYHTGTSASAPLAAGICALVLQANPNLTWRDLQHILVETARRANLETDDWVKNGIGRDVSHHFGFGLMDAGAMVRRALNWTNVPRQHRCIIQGNMSTRRIAQNTVANFPMKSDGCRGKEQHVRYLEHVQAMVTLAASRRGQVKISLTSPSGTKSVLLEKRSRDSSAEGFENWAFMTTHNWGEFSYGNWTLEISNTGTNSALKNWSLVLYGTATDPHQGNNVQRHPNNPNQECQKAQVFFNGNCIDKCPTTFFPTNMTYEMLQNVTVNASDPTLEGEQVIEQVNVTRWGLGCESCHDNCYECFGSGADHCTACVDNYTLKNDTCVYNFGDDLLDFFMRHEKGMLYGLVGLAGVGAVLVFLITFFILQCRSHGRCCCKKKLTEDYKFKYRRPEEGHGNLGNKSANLRNGNPELISQEESLLATYDNRVEEFDDDEIFDDHIDFEKIQSTAPTSKI